MALNRRGHGKLRSSNLITSAIARSGSRRSLSRRAGSHLRLESSGAVLGLIQVMQNLDRIDEVGRGIAVAFVATVYCVGAANLLFLPAAGKLRIRLRDEQVRREMVLEGVISILERHESSHAAKFVA